MALMLREPYAPAVSVNGSAMAPGTSGARCNMLFRPSLHLESHFISAYGCNRILQLPANILTAPGKRLSFISCRTSDVKSLRIAYRANKRVASRAANRVRL
jgi:hypothetical protein